MIIGYGKNGQKLVWGDICSFKIDGKEYEGMINYDEDVFSYVFEMKDDNFPCVKMSRVDLDSIVVIINVNSTRPYKDGYGFYRELVIR